MSYCPLTNQYPGVKASAYNPTLSAPECPDFTSMFWEVQPTAALPSLGQVYDAQASTTSGPSGTSRATGQASASASASATPGAAAASLSGELKGVGAALAGVMALFVWL